MFNRSYTVATTTIFYYKRSYILTTCTNIKYVRQLILYKIKRAAKTKQEEMILTPDNIALDLLILGLIIVSE